MSRSAERAVWPSILFWWGIAWLLHWNEVAGVFGGFVLGCVTAVMVTEPLIRFVVKFRLKGDWPRFEVQQRGDRFVLSLVVKGPDYRSRQIGEDFPDAPAAFRAAEFVRRYGMHAVIDDEIH